MLLDQKDYMNRTQWAMEDQLWMEKWEETYMTWSKEMMKNNLLIVHYEVLRCVYVLNSNMFN